ncbi:Protein of unknown function [Collimonas sp. OK607]|uniref:DUF4255 domain-containing protein n=1 Tax=Collimonas sp. OK607 TaxID=1798194 RepID=UPI0008F28879|nr:DUF4255 domain-containing protein [Collimonas sp. OK607]SFA98956.1 Protein of unknown function [Collimonas sp. OK607]
MINAAVSHLAVQLNQSLKQTYALTEDIVLMSGLVDADGHAAPNTNNKLVVFLTNLEKDTVPYRQQTSSAAGASRTVVSNAPLYLNLYVMIAANFSGANYSEALKLISGAIAYFQRFPVFDHQVTPELDPRIEKLVLDIENLKIHELSNIWTLLGSKYLPSVLYKVRMVALDADDIVARVPNVRLPASAANH